MAVGKENTALHVALIIFVLLTIVLSVTTFIFYKEYEEAEGNRATAVKEMEKAVKEKASAVADTKRIKELVGKENETGATVEAILDEFHRQQQEFAATYQGSDATIYPAIFEYQRDQYLKLQAEIADYQDQIAKLKADFAQQLATAQKKYDELNSSFKGQVAEIAKIKQGFVADRQKHTQQLSAYTKQVSDKQQEVLTQADQAKKQQEELTQQLRQKNQDLVSATQEVESYKEFDSAKPDGKIVSVNQAKGTVWIDLGQADGLRRQTTFTVFSYDVNNVENAVSKGAIEVVRIVNPHLAEARVTEDFDTDPIVRDDKIFSSVFRPGRPEGFAIAGLIDMDGDDQSDITQLIALIKSNGGVVDAYIDDAARRSGTMSAATKFLVIGERPTETTDPKLITAFDRMLDEASKYGVKTIGLSDFLDYMGYQGRERSIGLGRGANPDDFSAGSKRGAFRRREAGGEKKGAY